MKREKKGRKKVTENCPCITALSLLAMCRTGGWMQSRVATLTALCLKGPSNVTLILSQSLFKGTELNSPDFFFYYDSTDFLQTHFCCYQEMIKFSHHIMPGNTTVPSATSPMEKPTSSFSFTSSSPSSSSSSSMEEEAPAGIKKKPVSFSLPPHRSIYEFQFCLCFLPPIWRNSLLATSAPPAPRSWGQSRELAVLDCKEVNPVCTS